MVNPYVDYLRKNKYISRPSLTQNTETSFPAIIQNIQTLKYLWIVGKTTKQPIFVHMNIMTKWWQSVIRNVSI